MSLKKNELLLAALIRQVDPMITSGANLTVLYRAIGDCFLEHEGRRDYSRDQLYQLFRGLQSHLLKQRGVVMPNPGQLKNLAAAYRGINPSLINRSLLRLDWPIHMELLRLVKETPARLFYLRKAIENGWDYTGLRQAVESGQYQATGGADAIYFIRIRIRQSQIYRDKAGR
ncbi:MAG TPA: DUF1016 N-terminal domain-containing protein [Puia sp.]|jgi:hypothetical protein|nr:DUF1016 N-terminal domain-containing protein [Puia sp.]